MKKLLILTLALIVAVSCFAGCTKKATTENPAPSPAASDFDYIKSKGKMTIGYTDFAPMNYTDESGNFVGFDTEFAIAVCEKLGVEPDFVEIDWDNKFAALESKSIDCIWNGMTITDEVKMNTNCTNAYVINAQVVVMLKENADKYKAVEDMKDLTFAAESGSAGAAAIKDNGLDANMVEVGSQTDALLEVMSGSVDACVIDITMADSMIGEGTSYENLKATIELTSEEYGIGFRKGSDVTGKVNEIMEQLKADGTLDKLAETYKLKLAL